MMLSSSNKTPYALLPYALAVVLTLSTLAVVVGWALVRSQPSSMTLLYPTNMQPVSAESTDQDPKPHRENLPKLVYGFSPFWNLRRTTIQPELTHFLYFSLPLTKDGDLDGVTTQGRSVSRTRWESASLQNMIGTLTPDQEIGVVFTQFSNADIEALLTSPAAQSRYITSLTTLLETSPYPITAINLDIEYNGEASPALRQGYVEMTKNTRRVLLEHRKKTGRSIALSLCMYASAAKKPWIWDVGALSPHLDHFVVMAYDFHRASSPVAGPVAPIFGGRDAWDSDIMMHLREFLSITTPDKILLGIPFYGYEWQTTARESGSTVFPGSGSTASLSRAQQLLQNPGELVDLQQGWDELALSPYLTFSKEDRSYVMYYEDARSLRYKLDLVTDLDLAGVAIWALGYEDALREPWNEIRDALRPDLMTLPTSPSTAPPL